MFKKGWIPAIAGTSVAVILSSAALAATITVVTIFPKGLTEAYGTVVELHIPASERRLIR